MLFIEMLIFVVFAVWFILMGITEGHNGSVFARLNGTQYHIVRIIQTACVTSLVFLPSVIHTQLFIGWFFISWGMYELMHNKFSGMAAHWNGYKLYLGIRIPDYFWFLLTALGAGIILYTILN